MDRERIGLVLVSGDTALSLRFSRTIGRLAKRSGVALFVFSGGIPTKEQVAGEAFTTLILFVDPLRGEEESFVDLSLFGHTPCIVVNGSNTESSSLLCNLYSATVDLMEYTLKEKSRIAYIQGAVSSRLAGQSFQAYRDTLVKQNIPLDFTLVSDSGLLELIDDRGLVAGQDFDAIFCFSDEEALTLTIQARSRGITIPVVVGAAFGGSLHPSVVLPISSMALAAWKLALTTEVGEYLFDCEVAYSNSLARQDLFSNKDDLLTAVVHGYDLDEDDAQTIEKIIDGCAFFDAPKVEALITQFLIEGGSLTLLQRLIAGFSLLDRGNLELFAALLLHCSQIETGLRREQHALFTRIERDLARRASFSSVGKHLCLLGITRWFLVQGQIRSRVIASSHSTTGIEEALGASFDSGLLPPFLESLLNKGCWISIPLGYETQMGYILVETSFLQPEQMLLCKALFSTPFVSEESTCIVAIGSGPSSLAQSLGGFKGIVLQNNQEFFSAIQKGHPALLIVDRVDIPFFTEVRSRKATSSTLIVVVKDSFSPQDAEDVLFISRLIMVHSSVAKQKSFLVRLASLIAGEGVTLPTMTAALVKRAIIYIDKSAQTQFSRLDIAEAVNASEDYVGRVFRKEMGLSLWDYLHIHRIGGAITLLRTTPLSITEIALRSGFKDLAYFSRVFKKVMGFPPSQIHS